MKHLTTICILFLLCLVNVAYSQPGMDNWQYQGSTPAFNNVCTEPSTQQNSHTHTQLSAITNPSDPAEVWTAEYWGGTYPGNGAYPYTHIVYWHSTNFGSNWSPSSNTQVNYVPAFTTRNSGYNSFYTNFSSPSIAYRAKGDNTTTPGPTLVCALQARTNALGSGNGTSENGIFLLTTNSKDPATPNATTTDWNMTNIHRLRENCQMSTTGTENFASRPYVAVDNSQGQANSHYGRVYVLWQEIEAKATVNTGLDYNNWKIQFAAVDVDQTWANTGSNPCDGYDTGADILSRNTNLAGSSQHQVEAGSIVVGPDGTVFISYLQYDSYDWYGSSTRGYGCEVKVKYSTDGGTTFQDYGGSDLTFQHAGHWTMSSGSEYDAGFFTDFASILSYSPTTQSIPASGLPHMTVGNDNSGSYYVYLTWASLGNSTNDHYHHSEIQLARINYTVSTGTMEATVDPVGVLSIKSGGLEYGGDDVFQFGPSVAIDPEEGLQLSYLSTIVGSSSVNTSVIICRQLRFGTPSEFIVANSATMVPYDECSANGNDPCRDFTERTATFVDEDAGKGVLAVWIDGRNSVNSTISDNYKDIYCQHYDLPWGIHGITNYSSQRKMVFDGQRYHIICEGPGGHPTEKSRYIYYAWGYKPTKWEHVKCLTADLLTSEHQPSISMYKNGDTVIVGMAWLTDLDKANPETGNDEGQISFARLKLIYVPASGSVARHVGSEEWILPSAANYVEQFDFYNGGTFSPYEGDWSPIVPVIAPVVMGVSPANGSSEIYGQDSNLVDQYTSGGGNPKYCEGFMIVFRHTEGYLNPLDDKTIKAATSLPSPPVSYVNGLLAVMVNVDGTVISGTPIHNTGTTAVPSSYVVDEDAPNCSCTTDEFNWLPSLAGCEALGAASAVMSGGTTLEPSRNRSDFLSWTKETVEWNAGRWMILHDNSQIHYSRLSGVVTYPAAPRFSITTNEKTTLPANTGNAGTNDVDSNHASSIATQAWKDVAGPFGVPIIAYDGYFVHRNWNIVGFPLTRTPSVFVQKSNTSYKWLNVIDTWSSGFSPSNPTLNLQNPSVTTNAYHASGAGATYQPNNDLTAVTFECYDPNLFTQRMMVGRYIKDHNWMDKSPNNVTGYWPTTTFQTYGHYSWLETLGGVTHARNVTNGLYSDDGWMIDDPVQIEDPAMNHNIFAKTLGDSLGISYLNYRSYRIGVDTFNYFAYTTGGFIRCPANPDSLPKLIGFQDISDSLSIISKSDIETVLNTETFPIHNNDTLVFFHDAVPSDTIMSYLNLGAGHGITYSMTLITNNGTIPIETINISGASDTMDIISCFVSHPFDTVVVHGTGITSGNLHISATINDGNSTDYIQKDSIAYQVYNIFAADSTSYLLGKRSIRYAGRVGSVDIGINPIQLTINPNPSLGQSSVGFNVPVGDGDDEVEVRMFDMNARDIAIPVKMDLSQGMHHVAFDGSLLPSGQYVVSVHTRNHLQSKIVILQK